MPTQPAPRAQVGEDRPQPASGPPSSRGASVPEQAGLPAKRLEIGSPPDLALSPTFARLIAKLDRIIELLANRSTT